MSFFEFYIQYEYLFAALQLVLAMFGMGATLTLGDFSIILKQPRGLMVGLLLQLLGVPLITWLFITCLPVEPGLAVGLAFCAGVAGGTTSNIVAYYARASVALSIALTAISTFACLITFPIVLDFLISGSMPGDFEMPVLDIALEILLYLLLPLLGGMLFLRYFPRQAPILSRLSIRLSLLVIVLIVAGSEGAGKLDRDAFGINNALLVWAFLLALMLMSAIVPLFFRLSHGDVGAINIEVTIRNINLALLVKAMLFPSVTGVFDPVADIALFTLLIYAGGSMLLSGVMIAFYRWRSRVGVAYA